MTTQTLPLPDLDGAQVVVPAPDSGPGNWSGAASAFQADEMTYLAYRVRRPLTEGRGVSTVVSRSLDGVIFEPVCEVFRDEFGAESFERPVVLRTPEGGWRLYLSCATPGSKHWWIEALDADRPEDLPTGRRTVVLAGDDRVAVKDPVILVDEAGRWHAWICEHPLTDAGDEDRMTTAYWTSTDGLSWQRHGTVLRPRPGEWDARGTRISTVLSLDPLVVLYDGRRTAAENWHERTGLARRAGDAYAAVPGDPIADVRYLDVVALPGRGHRIFYEFRLPDDSHELRTELIA